MSELNDAAGKRLQTLMTQRGFNVESLSEATGLSLRTLARMRKGEFGSVEKLVILAKALDASIDWLLTEKGLPHSVTADSTALLTDYYNATDAIREAAIVVLLASPKRPKPHLTTQRSRIR